MLYWWGPNIEADFLSAYNNVQVDCGAPNIENFERKFYRQCKLGWGPKHREIGLPISTSNASWGGAPNIEKLDCQFLQAMQVGVERNKFC